jgi:hypothetical protein
MMTASFQGVMYGTVHYHSIDMDKGDALKESKGNFNCHMTLSSLSVEDLHWWVASIPSALMLYDIVITILFYRLMPRSQFGVVS